MTTQNGQLTDGARHYGITTKGAAFHIETMLGDDADWSLVTGFDRACIAEVLAFARKQGLQPALGTAPLEVKDIPVPPGVAESAEYIRKLDEEVEKAVGLPGIPRRGVNLVEEEGGKLS